MSSLLIHFFMRLSTTFTYMTSNNKKCGLKNKRPKIPPLVERVCCWGVGMYFGISCSLRWFPTPITTEKRSAMWFMRDKMCWTLFSWIEVSIGRFHTLSCVYSYIIFVIIISTSMLFESLNFADMIESGVTCRPPFVRLSEKCDSIKWLIYCFTSKGTDYSHT